MQHVIVPQPESLTCIPAPGVASLHLVHPGLVPRVGKVHQQHQLDQNEKESSTGAHHKPCCDNTHRSFSYFYLSIIC